ICDLPDPRILEPAAGGGRVFGFWPPQNAGGSDRTPGELRPLAAPVLQTLFAPVPAHPAGFWGAPAPDGWVACAGCSDPVRGVPEGQPAVSYAQHPQLFLRESAHESATWRCPSLYHFEVHAGRAVSGGGPSPHARLCRSFGGGKAAFGHISRHRRRDGSGLHA